MNLNPQMSKKWQELKLGRKRSFKGSDIYILSDKLNVTIPDKIIDLIKNSKPLHTKTQSKEVIDWVAQNLTKGIVTKEKPISKLKRMIDNHQSKIGITNYNFQGLCISLNLKDGTNAKYDSIVQAYGEESLDTPVSDLDDDKINKLISLLEEGKKNDSNT